MKSLWKATSYHKMLEAQAITRQCHQIIAVYAKLAPCELGKSEIINQILICL